MWLNPAWRRHPEKSLRLRDRSRGCKVLLSGSGWGPAPPGRVLPPLTDVACATSSRVQFQESLCGCLISLWPDERQRMLGGVELDQLRTGFASLSEPRRLRRNLSGVSFVMRGRGEVSAGVRGPTRGVSPSAVSPVGRLAPCRPPGAQPDAARGQSRQNLRCFLLTEVRTCLVFSGSIFSSQSGDRDFLGNP